jgi:hypothetical protein
LDRPEAKQVDMTETPLRGVLDAAEPKPSPDGDRGDKKNYAQRLSNLLATFLADALRQRFPDITPLPDGSQQEARVAVDGGQKRLDVKVTDPTLGLLLNISIKTYSFRDYDNGRRRLGRWTKNIVRNDHELRGEAMVLHQRQPYSVLIAVLFEPFATCDDGDPDSKADVNKSSFAHHVATLYKRSGRGKRPVYGAGSTAWVDFGADDPRYELFERVFIALYETEGDSRGEVRFFDVEKSPPRNGRPKTSDTLSLEQFSAIVDSEVGRRNRIAPTWAPAEPDGE